MTQLTLTRPNPLQPTAPADPDEFRTQIAATMAAHSALVARLAERLEQARYEARSLVAKAV